MTQFGGSLYVEETWGIEEMLQEQLGFMTSNGFTYIVHAGTGKPYYAYELAEWYAKIEMKRLMKEHLKTVPRKKAFTEVQIEQLKHDREAGVSIRELARKYNKSTATIQKYLKL